MTEELILTGVVGEWADRALPGEPAARQAATQLALSRYAAGASVAEALEEARALLASWARHPAHAVRSPGPLRVAS